MSMVGLKRPDWVYWPGWHQCYGSWGPCKVHMGYEVSVRQPRVLSTWMWVLQIRWHRKDEKELLWGSVLASIHRGTWPTRSAPLVTREFDPVRKWTHSEKEIGSWAYSWLAPQVLTDLDLIAYTVKREEDGSYSHG